MTTELNFSVKKNTDFTLTFTAKDADDVAIDLTSATIKWAVKETDDENAANLISKATGGNGITITNAASGIFQVAIDNTDTADLDAGDYIHEATITLGSGRIITLTDLDGEEGVITLRPQYTAP